RQFSVYRPSTSRVDRDFRDQFLAKRRNAPVYDVHENDRAENSEGWQDFGADGEGGVDPEGGGGFAARADARRDRGARVRALPGARQPGRLQRGRLADGRG